MSAKYLFIKICPKALINSLYTLYYRGKAILCGLDATFHSEKMKYYCPCCGLRLRTFILGSYRNYPNRINASRYEHTQQNVLCPVCKSLPRHRILAVWCDEHKELLKSADILYFAPDISEAKWMRRNGIDFTSADLYKKADLKIDIQATGLSDEKYDVVICNHVLEHVDDFRVALKEMFRILRLDGLLICSFPMDPQIELVDEDRSVNTAEERIRRFGQHDHKRVFGMKADQFLMEAGFTVEMIDGKDYPNEILPVVGPADYDINILFCCRKS